MNGALVRWEASTLGDTRRRRTLELLSAPERARWDSTPSPEAADRFLVGRMLLRELTAELLRIPIESVSVSAVCASCGGPHGRPEIVVGDTASAPPHASLSSTPGIVVAAVLPAGTGAAIGIDVESVVGSRERISAIEDLAPGRRGSARSLLRRWTRVEAVLKADGRGLRVDPRAVRLLRTAGRITASVAGSETNYTVFGRDVDSTIGLGRRAVVSVAIAGAVSEPQATTAVRARTATP